MSIPESFVEDLKGRVDIAEVIGQRISLKKSGSDYTACCPFHDDKNPSFSVSTKKSMYYCHSCDEGGDIVKFVMNYDRLDFPQAIKSIADLAGVEVPSDQSITPDHKAALLAKKDLKSKLPDVLKNASGFFYKALKNNESARNYLSSRGVNAEIAKRFALGSSSSLLNSDFDQQLLLKAGLIKEQDGGKGFYDVFRNRVMFPIRDERGSTVGFGGRVLDDAKPKYLNSADSAVFNKSKVLYGLHEAITIDRKPSHLIVVEGYMDVVSLAIAGVDNAVAGMGTAFTADHAKLVFKYVDEVVFCFDGDAAGLKAAKKVLSVVGPYVVAGKSCRFVTLPETGRYSGIDEKTGQPIPEFYDPDLFVKDKGKAAFNELVMNAANFSNFLLGTCEQELDLKTPEGRNQFCQRFSALVSDLDDSPFLTELCKAAAKRSGNTQSSIKKIIESKPASHALAPRLGAKADLSDWECKLLTDIEGTIKPYASNIKRILLNDPVWQGVLAFDDFSVRMMKLKEPPWEGGEVGVWTDNDDTELQIWLQEEYLMPLKSHTESTKAAIAVAMKNHFHAVRDWLNGLPDWDGQHRLQNLFIRGFSAPDSEYTRHIAIGWLVSAIARVMDPGCKVDTMIILEGLQGRGKSSAIRTIFSPDWYIDSSEQPGSKDFIITMMGNWVVEIGEMQSFNKSDRSLVKQMITKQADKIRLPYGRSLSDLPRQCIFTGTTNEDVYLSDPTGARRFLPVRCGTIDLQWISSHRQQLWAEALTHFKNGFEWWSYPEDEAQAEQVDRNDEHVWTEPIMRFLDRTHIDDFNYIEFGAIDRIDQVSTYQVMTYALKMPSEKQNKAHQMAVSDVMKQIGWKRTKHERQHCGRKARVWQRPE